MRFDPIPSFADPASLSDQIKPRHRLQVVPLSNTLSAAFFDAQDHTSVPTSLMSAWSGAEALCRPLLGSRLTRRDGGVRYVFFLARSSRELCSTGLTITFEDRPVAEIDPAALQSPVVDALALIVGLSPDGERRLLRALLTTGLSLFGDRAYRGIRDIVQQLLERLAPPPLALRAWCPLGETAAIASYTLPKDLAVGHIGTLVAIARSSAHLLAGVEADRETVNGERLFHLFLPEGAAPGTTLVALSETPLRLAGPAPAQRQRPLGPWLAQRTAQIRRATRHRLDALAAEDETAAALVAEVSCPKTALPEVTPHLFCCTTSGIFYFAAVDDTRRLLGQLVLRTEGADILLPLGAPLHHPGLGPVQLGFVPTSVECAPGDEAGLYALYRSGRMSRIGDVTLEPLPKTVPKLLAELPDHAVAPTLSAALADTLSNRQPVTGNVIPVAPSATTPQVTLVIEMGASLDYPFALCARLADRDDVALLLHHPDRRTLAALRTIAEELHAIYGIGVDLLDIAEDDVLPAERMRTAVARASTDTVIFLSADTLPLTGSWLDPWRAQLSRPGPVLAGAMVCSHEAGPPDPGAPPSGAAAGAGPRPQDHISPGAFGLNAAARARLVQMPLRVGGRTADLRDLGATLRAEADGHVMLDPSIRMTAYARAPDRPAALTLAEELILAGEVSA